MHIDNINKIAIRASNLKERLALLAHLQQYNSPLLNIESTNVQSDVWAIDKFLTKLTVTQVLYD